MLYKLQKQFRIFCWLQKLFKMIFWTIPQCILLNLRNNSKDKNVNSFPWDRLRAKFLSNNRESWCIFETLSPESWKHVLPILQYLSLGRDILIINHCFPWWACWLCSIRLTLAYHTGGRLVGKTSSLLPLPLHVCRGLINTRCRPALPLLRVDRS